MLREMRYYQQLDHKLSKEVVRTKKKYKLTEGVRHRHEQDIRQVILVKYSNKLYINKDKLSDNIIMNLLIMSKKIDRKKLMQLEGVYI